jgi:REP-associated tyrosine transposase
MKQTGFEFRTWGGKRKGAGRRPKGAEAGVAHRRRPVVTAKVPVHVTVRMLPHVWNLRSRRSFRVIGRAIYAAAERFDARICTYSVHGNHVHIVAEAASPRALGRSMKGFGVRVAKGLNKMMDRKGRVLADRYHEHVLRTPTEVRRAVHYVLGNFRKHAPHVIFSAGFRDPYSSFNPDVPLPSPRTWPLTEMLRELAVTAT